MSHLVEADRRRFLHGTVALAAAALLEPVPVRARGSVVDVRSKGARGDGNRDDTAAIQAAVNAVPSGGTVRIPAGNYLIDASRAIRLSSNIRLEMDEGAQLTALPNALKRYSVIRVLRADNVQIVGGRIVGERDHHHGDKGEWGYGINILGSRHVTVSGTHISDCWGDGILISDLGKGPSAYMASDITVRNVVSTGNRRQGMSLTACSRIRILDSTFSGTDGTAPQSGIDLEPMKQGPTTDVLIQGCTLRGNKGCGVEIHHGVSGLVVRRCTIESNEGYGILSVGGRNLWFDDNAISSNGMNGITIAGHSNDVRITGNTLSSNSTRYVHRALKALVSGKKESGPHKTDLRIDSSASNVRVSGNQFAS